VGGEAENLTLAEARSALAWWLDAGVDVAVQEEPRDWLKLPLLKSTSVAEPPPQTNLVEPSRETLGELQHWLASSLSLPLAGPAAKRVLPHGREEAAVMLLSDAPTLEDAAAAQPIGGEAWTLTQRMLAAIGLSAEDAYSASLSCFSTPG